MPQPKIGRLQSSFRSVRDQLNIYRVHPNIRYKISTYNYYQSCIPSATKKSKGDGLFCDIRLLDALIVAEESTFERSNTEVQNRQDGN